MLNICCSTRQHDESMSCNLFKINHYNELGNDIWIIMLSPPIIVQRDRRYEINHFPIRKGKKTLWTFHRQISKQSTLVIYCDKQARRLYFSKLIYFNQTEPSQTMISRKNPLFIPSTDGQ
ncbi:uncharacterized protein LOC130895047 [Diorhabda carinulata]|uniref:uncharacterized protein LOC130895047 n=1 Tax=Diorhabda carinulata TaxID=1163345 RepID=UPI0025A19782|nr:uncharacterized protein LOC130895047 [Diorhabda carinulata]